MTANQHYVCYVRYGVLINSVYVKEHFVVLLSVCCPSFYTVETLINFSSDQSVVHTVCRV